MAQEYDVCFSFAGEDRPYVSKVAAELIRLGVRVFYDEYEEAALWGKDLYQHLADVYQNRAAYCVIFVSAAYARKVWPRHELANAQARALRENREYILPARFDDTAVPGLPETTSYVDLRRKSAEEFAVLVRAKVLGEKPSDEESTSRETATGSQPVGDEIVDLENLLNSPTSTEADFQRLFEQHPTLLTGEQYRQVYPQPILRAGTDVLIPDFILADSQFGRYSIVELEPPSVRIIVGKSGRQRLSAAVYRALTQAREYQTWFKSNANVSDLQLKLGLNVRDPKLVVVVGRSAEFTTGSDRGLLRSTYPDIEFVTYDELLELARRRRKKSGA